MSAVCGCSSKIDMSKFDEITDINFYEVVEKKNPKNKIRIMVQTVKKARKQKSKKN